MSAPTDIKKYWYLCEACDYPHNYKDKPAYKGYDPAAKQIIISCHKNKESILIGP